MIQRTRLKTKQTQKLAIDAAPNSFFLMDDSLLAQQGREFN
jgi:hypothetical protein